MRKLLLNEQETVITFNGQEAEAELYTCYPPMMRKLDGLCQKNPDVYTCIRNTGIGKTYRFPKELITLRSRKKTRGTQAAVLGSEPGL